MPVKLREFYWRELLKAKEAERESFENASKPKNTSTRISRK